jgi:hypothetical protein
MMGAGRSTRTAAIPAGTSSSARGARKRATTARPTIVPSQAFRVRERRRAHVDSGITRAASVVPVAAVGHAPRETAM